LEDFLKELFICLNHNKTYLGHFYGGKLSLVPIISSVLPVRKTSANGGELFATIIKYA
jgi:hypothetical protein